ncbi:APC family permease [Pseudomonas sp. DWRC2-2]|uniref:APC family permease n=1 Tax=Pseudomonas sp. DWRC2-2 TaxID=2804567 RepID=UPI003CF6874C
MREAAAIDTKPGIIPYPETTPTSQSSDKLKRVLGLPSLVLFGLAYMIPLTVFTTYGLVTTGTSGHLPLAYIVTLIVMLFTAYSYGRMASKHPIAGSAYSYARIAFGGNAGFLVGWALMLDYLFMPMICYLVISIYMTPYFPEIPSAAWIIGCLLTVLVLNILGIKLVAKVNLILVVAQIVFVAVFIAISLKTVSQNPPPSFTYPFFDSGINISALLSGAAILCFSFLGFDAVSTLSEETVNPKHNMPKAIMLCTFVSGLLYIAISYVGHIVYPDWQSLTNPDSASLDVMQRAGGHFLSAFFTAVYVAACFASAMAAQASVTRVLYAMGRDDVLPKRIFGSTWKRFGTPAMATIVVSLISLTALEISLELATTMISFGALVGFSFVNLSVCKVFLSEQENRTAIGYFRYGVLPAIGLILTLWLWTSLTRQSFEVGLIWLGIGIVYLLWITKGFTKKLPKSHSENI